MTPSATTLAASSRSATRPCGTTTAIRRGWTRPARLRRAPARRAAAPRLRRAPARRAAARARLAGRAAARARRADRARIDSARGSELEPSSLKQLIERAPIRVALGLGRQERVQGVELIGAGVRAVLQDFRERCYA